MDFLPTAQIGQTGVEFVPSEDGTKLAVRVAGGSGQRTPLIMLHGLQSHSGWFVQSQSFLAGLGFPVYAMDRRGSGLSEGARGDCTNFRQMGNDVLAVVHYARAQHEVDAVHVRPPGHQAQAAHVTAASPDRHQTSRFAVAVTVCRPL